MDFHGFPMLRLQGFGQTIPQSLPPPVIYHEEAKRGVPGNSEGYKVRPPKKTIAKRQVDANNLLNYLNCLNYIGN